MGFWKNLFTSKEKQKNTKDVQPSALNDALYFQGLEALRNSNYETAVLKFEIAAEEGHPKAANNLGMLYAQGMGVEQDYAKAVKYWELSGTADANNNLGICYEKGMGVPLDKAKAAQYYTLAIAGGNKDAEQNLKAMNADSYDNLSMLTPDKLLPLAKSGDSHAQFFLAGCYYIGKGTGKDLRQAFFWMREAAKSGDANAQSNLASMYRNGEGTEPDITKAMMWLNKAVDNNNTDAILNLAMCYFLGDGVNQDSERGMQLLVKSAALGHAGAQQMLEQISNMNK